MYLQIDDSDLKGIISKMAVGLNGFVFMGIVSFNTALANVAANRAVFYREKAAGYYAAPAHVFSLYLSEAPFTLFVTGAFLAINCACPAAHRPSATYARAHAGTLTILPHPHLFPSATDFMVGFITDAGAFFTAWLATFLATLWYTYIGFWFIGWLPVVPLLAQILGGTTTQIALLFAGINLPQATFEGDGWLWLYKADGFAQALRLFLLPQYPDCSVPGCPMLLLPPNTRGPYTGYATTPIATGPLAGYEYVYKNEWAAARLGLGSGARWEALGALCGSIGGTLALGLLCWTFLNHQRK